MTFKAGTIPGYVVSRRVLKGARRASSYPWPAHMIFQYYQCRPNVLVITKIIIILLWMIRHSHLGLYYSNSYIAAYLAQVRT